jgi:hypothetical protein
LAATREYAVLAAMASATAATMAFVGPPMPGRMP